MPTESDQRAGQGLNLALGSPAPFYMTGEDNLRVRSLNAAAGVTLTLSGRLYGRGDRIVPFAIDHVPNTNRTIASTLSSIGEGWIMGLQVAVAAGAPLIGQCWALVDIVRGFTGATMAVGALASGYVTARQPVGWPGSPACGTLGGPGAIRSITGTDPAANVEWSETVPTGARWELIALFAELITSVAVANRFPMLVIDDGTRNLFRSDPGQAQVASLDYQYSAGQGTTRLGVVNFVTQWALPVGLVLPAGSRISSLTMNRQAADDWQAPQLLVKEWIEGA